MQYIPVEVAVSDDRSSVAVESGKCVVSAAEHPVSILPEDSEEDSVLRQRASDFVAMSMIESAWHQDTNNAYNMLTGGGSSLRWCVTTGSRKKAVVGNRICQPLPPAMTLRRVWPILLLI